MALILCWWSSDGAPVDERAWARMLRVAKREAGDRGSAPVVREAPGFRAAWIRTTRLEPGPELEIRPGSCHLRDARHADARPWGQERTATEPEAAIRFEGNRLVLSRDLLGQRPLVWTRVGNQVLAASREEILLAHPGVDTRFDDFHIACVMAWCDPPDDSTPFAEIRAVPAGACVQIRRDGFTMLRVNPEPAQGPALASQDVAARLLRERLEAAVQRGTEGADRIGLMLSAGIDSAALAALAARGRGSSTELVAVSYGLAPEDGGDIDERGPAATLARELGIGWTGIDAGSIELAFGGAGWRGPVASPMPNSFAELKSAVHATLAAQQPDVVLHGNGADQLTVPNTHWLVSAMRSAAWGDVASGLRAVIRESGWRGLLRHAPLRRTARWLVQGCSCLSRVTTPALLAPRWHEDWRELRHETLQRLRHWPDPPRAALHFSSTESLDYAVESLRTEALGLDLRAPFRDWELLRFILGTPLHWMGGPAGYKRLLIQAMSDVLPPDWLERPKCGDLTPLVRSAYRRQQDAIATHNRVDAEWLAQYINLPVLGGDEDDRMDAALRARLLLAWREHVDRVVRECRIEAGPA